MAWSPPTVDCRNLKLSGQLSCNLILISSIDVKFVHDKCKYVDTFPLSVVYTLSIFCIGQLVQCHEVPIIN